MATEDERKLFVAGLPESITEEILRQLFEATGGKVVDISLPRDRNTGRARGFGFVTLSTPEEAANARASLDGSLQAGRAMSVRPFQSEAPRRGEAREGPPRSSVAERAAGGDRTLYVGNLPYDCTQPQIEELFSSKGVGPVVRVHLPVGPDGRPRGFGFVTMGSADAANQALVSVRDTELKGRRISVSIAHPRERGDRPDSRIPGGDRSESYRPPAREITPEHRPSIPSEPSAVEGSESEEGRAAEGRRRGERPDKKKKKKAGRVEGRAAPAKRGRERHWEDWDEDD